jgi:transposase
MPKRAKLTSEAKIEIINQRFAGRPMEELSRTYGVHVRTLQKLMQRYHAKDEASILSRVSYQRYTKEFKDRVVREYIAGEGSSADLAIKYSIASISAVSRWVMEYNNGHRDARRVCPGGSVHMTEARKTTLEERAGIVVFCLENDHNYILTAMEFKVSYAQVYSWVRKYEARGLAGLKDTRGKGKAIEDMTDFEKLKAENKILEAKNYRLQMENDLLKKVREIERGYGSALSGLKDNTKR